MLPSYSPTTNMCGCCNYGELQAEKERDEGVGKPQGGSPGTLHHRGRGTGIPGKRGSSGRRRRPPQAQFARRNYLQPMSRYQSVLAVILVITRSETSSKQIIIGRVPTQSRDLQFLCFLEAKFPQRQ